MTGRAKATPSQKKGNTTKQPITRANKEKDVSAEDSSLCIEVDKSVCESVDKSLDKNMETIASELKSIKVELKDILKKGDIEQLISKTVSDVVKSFEEKLRNDFTKQMKEMISPLQEQIDYLQHENKVLADRLKEKTETIEKATSETVEIVHDHAIKINDSIKMSNYNEQYSRKNNIKIMDIVEENNETEAVLTDKVCSILSNAGTELRQSEILAIHRLPGRNNNSRPVIIKTINNSVKSRIMRKRKQLKESGHRLVDDVTRLNSGLINRLINHESMASAWFFNGSVYGQTKENERIKFDIFDTVSRVIAEFREKNQKL